MRPSVVLVWSKSGQNLCRGIHFVQTVIQFRSRMVLIWELSNNDPNLKLVHRSGEFGVSGIH